MRKVYLLLFTFLSIFLASNAGTATNDTLSIYLKSGKVDIIPNDYIKKQESKANTFLVTLNNDSLITYNLNEVDSLGGIPKDFPNFTMFKFNNKYNHNVYVDVFATIGENEITATIGAIGKSLTPSFQVSDPNALVFVDNELQTTKVSRHRFEKPVVYTITTPNYRRLDYIKVKDEIWSEETQGKCETEEIPLTVDMLSTNAPSNYGEDLDKLLDNNNDTYFHSTWGSGAYEKLPLNVAPYIEVSLNEAIEKFVFEYVTSSVHNNRYPHEFLIQASNDQKKWVDVATINESDGMPTYGMNAHFTSPCIRMKNQYRYLRFNMTRSSYKNYLVLADFKIKKVVSETGHIPPHIISPTQYAYRWVPFGKDIPVKIDWLTDKATNVPRIDINVEGGKMIEDKINYLKAQFIVDGAGVFPSMKDSMLIRGRGNSSWAGTGKSPYRLKFATAVKPFGLKKGKNWVLLANRNKGSMLTNAIGMKIANMAGSAGANQIVPVELYINGTYRGSYNLTQQVGLHNNSIDIIENNAVMLELDTYYDETFKFLNEYYGVHTNVKAPDFDETPIVPRTITFDMVKNDFNKFSRAVSYNTDEYTELMNIPMFARYMLVNEFIMNTELKHPKSCFLYKEDLLAMHSQYVFGPVWDLDWAYGYDVNYNYCTCNPNTNYFSLLNKNGGTFFKELLINSDIVRRAYYKEWKNFMSLHLQEVLDYIDDYYNYAKPSIDHNYSVWGDGYYYTTHVKNFKQWLQTRADYVFSHLKVYDIDTPLPIEIGDVNKDGAITVADAVCVQNYILGIENETFDITQADANKNGKINITDAVWIIAMALKAEANEIRHMQLPVADATLQAQHFAATVGCESLLPVTMNIQNENYTAAQFDVTLPEGVALEDISLPDEWHSYTAEFAEIGQQQYRIAIYTSNGTCLPKGATTLHLHVTPQEMIANENRVVSLSSATLVSKGGEDLRMGSMSTTFDMEATGVEDNSLNEAINGGNALHIESLNNGNVKVYTIDGRLIRECQVKTGMNTFQLPAGVYVVNQKKVIINK